MCGRYTLTRPELLPDLFEISDVNIPPRFNIAPTQLAPVVRLAGEDGREGALLRWGLIPHWMKEPPTGNQMINARAESLAEKPAFRDALRRRRCLVPADGFYEWRSTNGRKQPYYFRPRELPMFAFAGLWEQWRSPDDELVESFTIITCPANEIVRLVHPRMPVILRTEEYDLWLYEGAAKEVHQRLLTPCPPELLEAYPVSLRVNNPRNDSPDCIRPIEEL
ncbi:MAG: SOS response-associated peptidase [Acidobacteriota bacterium]